MPEISLIVARDQDDSFLELRMTRIEAGLQKGQEWVSLEMSVKDFVIVDLFSKCPDYPYLLESVATSGS